MNSFIAAALLTGLIPAVYAQDFQNQDGFGQAQALQEYFDAAPENANKSIIYVFYNNNDCYGCPQAMAMFEKLYQKRYADVYSLFMIDYQNDQEYDFINQYQLSRPLEVVMVRIQDGAAFGYEKIENLQNMTSDTVSFDDYVSNRIDNFLGDNG